MTHTEQKSRAELIEEIVGEFENFYIGSSQRRIIKEFLVPALLRISDASMDAVEVEIKDIVLPENHEMNGKTIHDWEGQDLFRKGQAAAIAASQQKRTLFTK